VRLAFLGSPPFALPVFERVLASPHEIAVLVTRPDKPQGRGRASAPSPLVLHARERGIPVLQPGSTRDPVFVASLRALEPEVLLVASYGEILREELLALAPHGALNVHASLLPRHRGASPIQAAILAGDPETGVSVQRMVKALDEGDVLLERRTKIGPRETAGELLPRLAELGGTAAVEALFQLARGTARFTPQDPARATYARKIAKEDGRIDWSRPAVELDRFVRAMTPWPGARTRTEDGRELVVLEAATVEPAPAKLVEWIGPDVLGPADAREGEGELVRFEPGRLVVVERALFVATGRGLLELRTLKPAGKGAMSADAWLRGAHLESGARFS
jgi:methionyl-tRNA formyltransferase